MELDPQWIEAAETLPIVVWTARPDGSIEYVNGRWEEATGLNAGQLIGEGWTNVVHPDDLARVSQA